ncbi:NAD(P)-dependent oxidoreductase [Xanthomonas euvesicatoria]|uniref:NAD(P)-dependent oxidoreductase n=1 Tax=Xanthomonas euvesicatoria TaxID=456327 RepID=UPI001C443FEA|nr:NAD(P)H-binding protein [Xanthomonas euvesicatoria]MBV6791824.1 NAD(P)H-binding protein [Xanthomonas campestris pv. clerodendri]
MKITLFGATGRIGPYLIREGLERGAELTVFARQQTLFANSDVRIIRGDLTDADLLREAVSGADAVLSALGPTKFPHPKDLPITRATQAIITAMEQEHVRRLIAVSTGTAADPGDSFDLKIHLPAVLLKLAMRAAYNDMIGLADVVRASTLDWTMVRAAVLKDRPPSAGLNVGLYGHTRHSLTISRADVARFMFDQVTQPTFVHQAPGVSSR